MPSGHRTVLLHEAVRELAIEADDVVVDATLGGGGHAKHIADNLGEKGVLLGIDADAAALTRAAVVLKNAKPKVRLVQGNFRELTTILVREGISEISKALFDLGWSGYQLSAERGFSFQHDEPLLMTYDDAPKEGARTAAEIVNTWEESSLADIIFGWGGERYSRRIARRIVEARAVRPLQSTRELAELVKAAVPAHYAHGRIHPATKTFQALRIAVNDEIGAMEEGIRAAFGALTENGRIAVITFHSVEDRAVKRLFLSLVSEGNAERITRKPICPGTQEILENPRARSAKLRVIRKTLHTTL